MSFSKTLVLDANILLRGVFGFRVRDLLERYQESVDFYAPDSCIDEAIRNVPAIAEAKSLDVQMSEGDLRELVQICILIVDRSFYAEFEGEARARISRRDPDDWPVIATALLLNAPIWTEDQDFFGTGIATWTSDRVEMYLRDA